MPDNCTSQKIPYADTGILKGLIEDYLAQRPDLKSFYRHSPDLSGIKASIAQRELFPVHRQQLVSVLKQQYAGLPEHPKVLEHIELLNHSNTFTVCTAHQPNLFTGPLYSIYKMVHAVRLATELESTLTGYRFVPVYYIGSEDADLEELGHAVVNGKKYTWQTPQQGAVGRMQVDKELTDLIEEMYAQLGVTSHGAAIVDLFRKAYTPGRKIADATHILVHHLLGPYGLVVLDPDSDELKKSFLPVAHKELAEGFSYKAVRETIEQFPSHYNVQAGGRPLNLFYLEGDARVRIDRETDHTFTAEGIFKNITQDELMKRFEESPARCSPNVILRPLFQEMILPNVAFIGGGGELGYWLELTKVFEAAAVPYPVLILRNSYLALQKKVADKWNRWGLPVEKMFLPETKLVQEFIRMKEGERIQLDDAMHEIQEVYNRMKAQAVAVDATLEKHVNALAHKAIQRIQQLEKKLLNRSKKQHELVLQQIHSFREMYFPGGSLQERVENVAGLYAAYGPAFIDAVYNHAGGLDMQFTVLLAESNHHT
ncbi:MAG TPA: bacillithiol biosynthesis cysteine-adding enzyme BshC [Ferruginibacter sp.]|nr:bacillithiol biosynthesis cysteine-adding enzyme BshC [Ferruginibacter sp.]HRQ21621.1 bacillithiol biosynthesis cysteine-adding enzyme BshC [Ferruginibacter sp.]